MINRYRFKLRLFLSFLKEHGCYEKYKENYYDIEKRFPKYHKYMPFNNLFQGNHIIYDGEELKLSLLLIK